MLTFILLCIGGFILGRAYQRQYTPHVSDLERALRAEVQSKEDEIQRLSSALYKAAKQLYPDSPSEAFKEFLK